MLTPEQKEIVKRARDRITDPVHWCRGEMARDIDGIPCSPISYRAAQFCAVGALAVEFLATCHGNYEGAMEKAIKVDLQFHLPVCLAAINDKEGHAAVLAVFDKALAS